MHIIDVASRAAIDEHGHTIAGRRVAYGLDKIKGMLIEHGEFANDLDHGSIACYRRF